jgi:transcriptional regulator with AAA-type ATPase domain
LRVLEERKILPRRRPISRLAVDVRLIGATKHRIWTNGRCGKEISAKIMFDIASTVIPIYLPALVERRPETSRPPLVELVHE